MSNDLELVEHKCQGKNCKLTWKGLSSEIQTLCYHCGPAINRKWTSHDRMLSPHRKKPKSKLKGKNESATIES